MEKNFFVSAGLRRVTLAVYIEAGHCRSAAGQYLQQHAVTTDTSRSLADWATVVEDLFLGASPEELAGYAAPESKAEKVASFRAKKWLGSVVLQDGCSSKTTKASRRHRRRCLRISPRQLDLASLRAWELQNELAGTLARNSRPRGAFVWAACKFRTPSPMRTSRPRLVNKTCWA